MIPQCDHAVALAVYSVFTVTGICLEYWLGKTNKTQAGSILELLITGAVALMALLTKHKQGE